MGKIDRHPLPNTPVTHRISARHNNRVGSVYSSLYGFWTARQHVLNETTGRARFERDVYTIIFFDQQTIEPVTNDSTRAPTELLHEVLKHGPGRGTNFTAGIERTQEAMTSSWSNERTPVVIFLSDGEGSISNDTMRDLCNRAVSLGCPLSFHAVSFGPSNTTLRRMASVASEVQNAASSDPTRPTVPSSYIEAADTVRLAETLLGLAESLRKTRGALIRG
ncbi:hypothetical protein QCA50_012495 [Cerrena zonata]|uniref:VWFA domain-containing protein n=1 Tax=Cerrena zonata TaxID=2478898 RepID=A0AAW0FSB8_9APHY